MYEQLEINGGNAIYHFLTGDWQDRVLLFGRPTDGTGLGHRVAPLGTSCNSLTFLITASSDLPPMVLTTYVMNVTELHTAVAYAKADGLLIYRPL